MRDLLLRRDALRRDFLNGLHLILGFDLLTMVLGRGLAILLSSDYYYFMTSAEISNVGFTKTYYGQPLFNSNSKISLETL